MKSLWQPDTVRVVHNRIERLSPDLKPAWGKMSAPQMVVHLTDCMKMATGELQVEPKKVFLRYPVVKQLILYLAPMPKGVPTARELIARQPTEWPDDVRQLRMAIDRFSSRDRGSSWPDHPVFGRMSARDWGVLAYRHVDHHLRQFGA